MELFNDYLDNNDIELEESLYDSEEKIEEKLPVDLKIGYLNDNPKDTEKFTKDPNYVSDRGRAPRSANWHGSYSIYGGTKYIDFDKTNYKVISKEEALTWPKKSELRFILVSDPKYRLGVYVLYYNDDGDIAVSKKSSSIDYFASRIESRLGKPSSIAEKCKFKDVVEVADKIYATNELDNIKTYDSARYVNRDRKPLARSEITRRRYNGTVMPDSRHKSLAGAIGNTYRDGDEIEFTSNRVKEIIKTIKELPYANKELVNLVNSYKKRISDTKTILSVCYTDNEKEWPDEKQRRYGRVGDRWNLDDKSRRLIDVIDSVNLANNKIKEAQKIIDEYNKELERLQPKLEEAQQMADEKFNSPEYQGRINNLYEDILKLKGNYEELKDTLEKYPSLKDYVNKQIKR